MCIRDSFLYYEDVDLAFRALLAGYHALLVAAEAVEDVAPEDRRRPGRGEDGVGLGGYEQRFFLYYEDVDLAFRAVLAGWHSLLVPSARVTHRLGATTRSHARARFYVARNSAWCAVRCLPQAGPRSLVRRWVLELRTNRPRHLAPVEIAGRLAGLAGLPRALRERRAIQAGRTAAMAQVEALLREPHGLGGRAPPEM